jgi:hypothetical protein
MKRASGEVSRLEKIQMELEGIVEKEFPTIDSTHKNDEKEFPTVVLDSTHKNDEKECSARKHDESKSSELYRKIIRDHATLEGKPSDSRRQTSELYSDHAILEGEIRQSYAMLDRVSAAIKNNGGTFNGNDCNGDFDSGDFNTSDAGFTGPTPGPTHNLNNRKNSTKNSSGTCSTNNSGTYSTNNSGADSTNNSSGISLMYSDNNDNNQFINGDCTVNNNQLSNSQGNNINQPNQINVNYQVELPQQINANQAKLQQQQQHQHQINVNQQEANFEARRRKMLIRQRKIEAKHLKSMIGSGVGVEE